MKANPEIIGLTSKGIEWQIKKLKEEGFIKRVSPAKGGHWEIVDGKKTEIRTYMDRVWEG